MGLFAVRAEVFSIRDPQKSRVLEFIVDTGATLSVIPQEVAEELGVEPEEEWPFVLADGRRTSYEIAWARIRIGNRAHPTIVVLGDRGSETLLGAFALEGFGLAVDPANERLVRVPGMLKQIAA